MSQEKKPTLEQKILSSASSVVVVRAGQIPPAIKQEIARALEIGKKAASKDESVR